MIPNRSRYLSSVSAELKAQATRVRDLIGDKHWLTDGHHKEYLLKDVLSRHVPSGVNVSRGFVLHPQRPDLVSREQDLAFVDTHAVAPIFDQGGVCISFPHQVVAAIAVKTTFRQDQLEDACDTLHSLRRVAAYAGLSTSPWCGVLFFEGGDLSKEQLGEKVVATLTSFEATAEQLPNMHSTPDVVAIAGTAGFVVDSVEAATRQTSIRGFAGDGTVLLLNGLLRQIARSRNSNAAELEQFLTAFEMEPLPGSPFSLT